VGGRPLNYALDLRGNCVAILLWVLAVLSASVIGVFVWGVRSLRRSASQARDAIANVRIADVARLSDECQAAFRNSFSEKLSLENYEAGAALLSRRIDDKSLKSALSKDEFWWYFVLPAGAFLGELLRVHTGAKWLETTDGAPEMRIPVGSGEATTFPFDKILKQATGGDKGDLYAYLIAARNLDQAVEQSIVDPSPTTGV
jgi:hypothetical protein